MSDSCILLMTVYGNVVEHNVIYLADDFNFY